MNNSYYLHHFEKHNIQKIKKLNPEEWENITIGDFIKVGFLFQEGEKKRIQFFEGIVIAIRKAHLNKKITLRKPGTYGVERIFACCSPQIQTLKILQSQSFRRSSGRSKLFFLRQRIGKAAFGLKGSFLQK